MSMSRYDAMRAAADGYVRGDVDGEELHSAVVDYTDSVAMEAPPLLGAPVQVGFTVIAAIPMFPGAFDTDYIVAAWRPALEHVMPVFGTWRASRLPPGPWLFEAGKYFTADDNTADAVREAAGKAVRSLAERAGPGLCSACGGPVGDVCWRCA